MLNCMDTWPSGFTKERDSVNSEISVTQGERASTGQSEVSKSANRSKSAENRQQNVQQVAHVAYDRHGHIAPRVRFGGSFEEFFVLLVESGLGGVFVVET